MKSRPTPFKKPPKRHEPKGLKILYEDRDIIVVDKKCGLLTVSNDKVREQTAYYLLTNYVRKGNPKSRHRIFLVHRLERDVSGVLLFARTPDAKRFLQEAWPTVKKTYCAVVQGEMPESAGLLESYLTENAIRTVYAVDKAKKGKLARTGYRVLKTSATRSLLELDLLTERKNQFRVQLAEQGCPIAGDKKYGEMARGAQRLMLHAWSLRFHHPYSEEEMTFFAELPPLFDLLLKR